MRSNIITRGIDNYLYLPLPVFDTKSACLFLFFVFCIACRWPIVCRSDHKTQIQLPVCFVLSFFFNSFLLFLFLLCDGRWGNFVCWSDIFLNRNSISRVQHRTCVFRFFFFFFFFFACRWPIMNFFFVDSSRIQHGKRGIFIFIDC